MFHTYLLHLCISTPAGVHSLAVLLMELQPGDDGPQTLAADALYQLSRVEEAYRLLLSVGPTCPRAPVLARLALLQLHRGFLYDTNQVFIVFYFQEMANKKKCLFFNPSVNKDFYVNHFLFAASKKAHSVRGHQLPTLTFGGGATEGSSAVAWALLLCCQTYPESLKRGELHQRGCGLPLHRNHGIW